MIEYTLDDGEFSMPDDIYAQIMAPLGYPFISDDELEYPQEQIVKLAISKGMREYFHWCPPVKSEICNVTRESQNVGMPIDCYGVVGLQLQQSGSGTAGGGVFGYAAELALYGGIGMGTGTYAGSVPPTMNLHNPGSYFENRAARQAIVNYNRRVHYEGPYINHGEVEGESEKYITIYSNTNGAFNIWWAKKSLNWQDIEFAQQQNVIDYCSACVKELFGNLRRQGQSKEGFDYGKWLEEAKSTKETIGKEWRSLVKYAGLSRLGGL